MILHIKQKTLAIELSRYLGDDFDVRYYAYYKASAFEYEDLKVASNSSFPNHVLYFFNTLLKLGNSKKTNLANTFPKISSKTFGRKYTLDRLAIKRI